MRISIEYTDEEKKFNERNKDVSYNATDFCLTVRYLQAVKSGKIVYSIPKTESLSCGGQDFREIKKELRQALLELDKL